jgi:hypothetical protein
MAGESKDIVHGLPSGTDPVFFYIDAKRYAEYRRVAIERLS